jgi:pyruvate/2-oxoglutarate/acetoin dehydrogenase E1 component
MRKIKYATAINEAQHIVMQRDQSVFQIGVGINTPWYVGQTMNGLLDTFGEHRMIDTPVSENGTTGVAIGAALSGLRPILTFPRMDFMYYAMDQICNHAASLNYSLGGNSPVPIVIRGIINRKGEQSAQHSQAIHGLFMHIPGLKVVMPSNAYDAKGMMIAAVEDNDPVIYIEDRELYSAECDVPEDYYTVALDKANVEIKGSDLTIVSSSYMLHQSKIAANILKEKNINAEVIDLRSIKPIDSETILNSVKKTGRLLVVDGGWLTGGLASEIITIVVTQGMKWLKTPPSRIALPDLPAPASYVLENAYYPDSNLIVKTALSLCL